MTLLHESLDKALDQAEQSASFRRLLGRKDKRPEGLSQMIAGPAAGGKTVQAHEYLAQMHDAGLIDSPVPHIIDCSMPRLEDFTKAVNNAKEGSAIIFDDLSESVSRQLQFRSLVSIIVQAYEKGVVIVLGEEEALKKALTEDPGMARRFPALITLDKSFSPAEQAAFDAERQRNPRKPRPSLSQRREAERYEKMMEELRTAKGDAFKLTRAIKPVTTVRFAPKGKAPT